MGHVISDLSKYVITFFMIIYTLECFVAVATKKEHERGGVYIRQIICMFMVHFLGFAAICLETEDVSYIIFYGFQQILLFATIALFRVAYPEADKLVINNMCMLLTISFIMLTRISYQKSIRQFIIVAVSLIIGLFIPFLVSKLKFLKHLTWIYGMVGVFALLVVAVLGSVTHGSKISYSINGFTFQPSEFVKILFVFFIAGLLTESKSLGQVVISAVAAAAHVIILVFSKDLGSAVIFFAGYLIMVFIATKNYFYLFAGILGGAGASIVAYHMFSHVRTRVIAFLHPWSNINDSGYQITQSLFAIGTGGWFGLGIDQGDPTSIPYVEQDFVFSDSCLCQLLYRIYEDCHAAERRFLQIYCGRDQYNLYISGISDDWRRNKIYPPDRCHTAACQLWRKQCADDDHHVQYHTGTLLHTITGRKTECSERKTKNCRSGSRRRIIKRKKE